MSKTKAKAEDNVSASSLSKHTSEEVTIRQKPIEKKAPNKPNTKSYQRLQSVCFFFNNFKRPKLTVNMTDFY